MRACTRGVWVLPFAIAFMPFGAAAEWPHWRGPDFDGKARASEVFRDQAFTLELAWTRPLGIGYSGISVVDDYAVTMYSDGTIDHLVALDPVTGETRWTHEIATWFPGEHGSEGGPKSTPAIEAGIVYALGPKGHLLAVRLKDGSELWRVPLHEKLELTSPEHGFATSPIVVGDLLIVQTGGIGGPGLSAVDKRTGQIVWFTEDEPTEFQSPIPTELAGVAQLLSATDSTVSGIDATTGERYWSASWTEARVFPTPVILDDDRFLLPGYWESLAFRVRRLDDGGLTVDELWKTRDLKGTTATPVLHEGFLYGYSGEFLTCVSAEDGKRVWKSRSPGGQGLIFVDGHLVIFGEGGTVVVAEASPKGYREKAKIDVFGRSGYAYPSFADGRIFVRTTRNIAAVRIMRAGQSIGLEERLREFGRITRIKVTRTAGGVTGWIGQHVVGPLFGAPGPQGLDDRPESAEPEDDGG